MPRKSQRDSQDVPKPVDRLLAQARAAHGHLPNVIGFGWGPRRRGGTETDEEVVIIYVDRKFATDAEIAAAGSRAIPQAISAGDESAGIDIVEACFIADDASAQPALNWVRQSRQDPVCPGLSIGDLVDPTHAGTLGAIVARHGRLFALSARHVLETPDPQRRVAQPGLLDTRVRVGQEEHLLLGYMIQAADMLAGDGALSSIRARRVSREILGLGVPVENVDLPQDGDIVVKSGRTKGVTYGKVSRLMVKQVALELKGSRYGGRKRLETPAFSIAPIDGARPGEPLSDGGDSGAAWMRCVQRRGRWVPTSTMVGIHVGRDTVSGAALACPVPLLFRALEIAPATEAQVLEHNAGVDVPMTSPAPAILAESTTAPISATHRVNARRGARLRPTAATRSFEDPALPAGTELVVLGHVDAADGRWAQVDLQGDGKTDGFIYADLLTPIGDPTPAAPLREHPLPAFGPSSVIDRVTPDLVATLFDRSASVRANIARHLPDVLEGLREFGLTDAMMVSMALATIAAETAGFSPISERESTKNTRKTPFDLYDGRYGNTRPGDGFRYRGRGFVQLTWRENYRTIGSQLGLPLEADPELANDSRIAGRILACFLFNKRNVILRGLQRGDEEGRRIARKAVNGGSHGFDRFNRCYLGAMRLLG
ncbi:MAG: hypothetical protein SNJ63_07995 [Sphingomonadaceae bacterium]